GQNLLGATPGGGAAQKSGTSFAAPVVSGFVALLLSLQIARGEKPDPYAVRNAILASAIPCDQQHFTDCRRFLVGRLNLPGAYSLISQRRRNPMSDDHTTEEGLRVGESGGVAQAEAPSISASQGLAAVLDSAVLDSAVERCEVGEPSSIRPAAKSSAGTPKGRPAVSSLRAAGLGPSCDCQSKSKRLVFAIGTIGYDFGTEAVRDSFKALMPNVTADGTPYSFEVFPNVVPFPANPYDPRQVVNYLGGYPPPGTPDARHGGFPTIGGFPAYNPAIPAPLPSPLPEYQPVLEASLPAATDLIWTLNVELTPIYAIRPTGSFSTEVYQRLVEFLAGQIRNPKKTPPGPENPDGEDDPDFVSRVSIPGLLTDETVQLYSGQVVPVVVPNWRAMYAWNENLLIDAVMEQVRETAALQQLDPDQLASIIDAVKKSLRNLLDRIYYDLRNMGQNSSERALNFVATNAFQAASVLAQTLIPSVAPLTASGAQTVLTGTLQLDTITTERSAFCRKDSDCWDVKLRFFDPDNILRARQVHRFTVDVSSAIPVQIGPVRTWAETG
ncbi:MAG: S8 family serine peptidase, partial [Pirellulales bacterium]